MITGTKYLRYTNSGSFKCFINSRAEPKKIVPVQSYEFNLDQMVTPSSFGSVFLIWCLNIPLYKRVYTIRHQRELSM
jgi:hypothetical protein